MPATNSREKKNDMARVPGSQGLDDELSLFVNSLIDQNAELAGRLQSIDSLMELAEKALVEADKEAKCIRMEAVREANAMAASILARAEEQARAAAQRIIDEAHEKTGEEARRIIAEGRRIIVEAEKKAEETLQEKLSLAEQQARDILKAAENKVSLIIEEAQKKAGEQAEHIRKQSEAKKDPCEASGELTGPLEGERETETASKTEEKPSEPPVPDAASGATAASTPHPVEPPPPVSEKKSRKKNHAYDSTAELTLPPPVVLDRVIRLLLHLKKDSGVKVVNVNGSLHKGVNIQLLAQAQTSITAMLTAIPEVEKVSDEPNDAEANGVHRRTITVTLKE